MRYAYVAVGVALIAIGAWHVFEDVFENDFLFQGLGAFAALSLVLIGVLNLLNHTYGRGARGVRIVSTAATFAFLAIAIWAQGGSWLEWLTIGLLASAGMLSFDRRSMKPHTPLN